MIRIYIYCKCLARDRIALHQSIPQGCHPQQRKVECTCSHAKQLHMSAAQIIDEQLRSEFKHLIFNLD